MDYDDAATEFAATSAGLSYENSRHLPLETNIAVNVIYLVATVLVTVMGNVGNVLVIGAVLTDRQLRTEGNILILNLAAADLCVTSFVQPCGMAGVFVGPEFWQRNSWFCHLIGTVCTASCVCSLYSIGAISFNRYILLCHQHLYSRIYTKRNVIWMCMGLWGMGLLLDLPNFLGWGDHTYDMKSMACSYDRTASYSFTVSFVMVFATIPLLVVVFSNVNIYILVHRSKRRVATHGMLAQPGKILTSGERSTDVCDDETSIGMTRKNANSISLTVPIRTMPGTMDADNHGPVGAIQENQPVQALADTKKTVAAEQKNLQKVGGKKMKSEIRLARTLFIIFVAFVICWVPYAVLCLYDQKDTLSKELYTVSMLFAHTSSTLNSVLYAATNKGFRQGYKHFLNRCGCKIT